MKLIIAGSRNLTKDEVYEFLNELNLIDVTEVISGKASTGGDYWGEQWAIEHNIPIKPFPANWNDLKSEPVLIKTKFGRQYNALAGFARNEKMAVYASQYLPYAALVAICKNQSNGTLDMIARAKKYNVPVLDKYIKE